MKTLKKYAYWKTITWRLVRVCTVTAIALYLPYLETGHVIPPKQLAVALVAGVLSAAFKLIRDALGDGTKTTVFDKLPL